MKRRTCIRNADDARPAPSPGVEPGVELLPLLRPYVRHCGDSLRSAWRIASRRLLDYLLVYIADGRGRFIIAGKTYEAAPGDLFWIPPDTPHAMEGFAPRMHCPYVHFDLVYRPTISHWDFSVPAGLEQLGELRALLHPPVDDARLRALTGRVRGPTNRRVGQLMIDICAEASRAQPYAGLRVSGMMVEIVAELLRGRAGLPLESIAHIPALEATADELARACAHPPASRALARRCALSVSQFRLLFQRHYHCSPRVYIRRARLRRARELMIGSNQTLSEIARQVGFATVHGLSRAFRAEEGITPTQYRRCAPTPRTYVEGRRAPYAR